MTYLQVVFIIVSGLIGLAAGAVAAQVIEDKTPHGCVVLCNRVTVSTWALRITAAFVSVTIAYSAIVYGILMLGAYK